MNDRRFGLTISRLKILKKCVVNLDIEYFNIVKVLFEHLQNYVYLVNLICQALSEAKMSVNKKSLRFFGNQVHMLFHIPF